MKSLLVMRHAEAIKDARMSDHDRPLTKLGEQEARRLGRLFRGLGPTHAISSTALRATRTAEIALRTAHATPVLERSGRLYDTDVSQHLSVIQSVEASVSQLLIVGHNPTLEALVSTLARQPTVLKTSALAILAVPVDRWEDLHEQSACCLVGLFLPDMLRRHVDRER